jgi:cell division transport system permease protein
MARQAGETPLKWAKLGFVLRRVRSSLWQLLWSHALTTITMAMTLFIFGAFMLLQENLQLLLKGWGDQIQINAYLDKNLAARDVEPLIKKVRHFPGVARVRHISQERAWKEFQATLGTQSAVLEGLPHDVLPASFEIAVKPEFRDTRSVGDLAEQIGKLKGITSVEYPQEWVDRLNLVVLAVRWAKWALGGVLFLVTFFIVGSTLRLAILARRDEIEIMQLVGASEELIQAPFVLEGMIQGMLGGCASVLGLWLLYRFLYRQLPPLLGGIGLSARMQFLDLNSVALILAIGCLLGATGSLFSLRRFVKTWRD